MLKQLKISAKTLKEWWDEKEKWVFKPAALGDSTGVYIGAQMTQRQLKSCDSDYVVQEFCTTRVSADGSNYDLRIYTNENEIFGGVTRHFFADKMDMQHPEAGLRRIELVDEINEGYMGIKSEDLGSQAYFHTKEELLQQEK